MDPKLYILIGEGSGFVLGLNRAKDFNDELISRIYTSECESIKIGDSDLKPIVGRAQPAFDINPINNSSISLDNRYICEVICYAKHKVGKYAFYSEIIILTIKSLFEVSTYDELDLKDFRKPLDLITYAYCHLLEDLVDYFEVLGLGVELENLIDNIPDFSRSNKTDLVMVFCLVLRKNMIEEVGEFGPVSTLDELIRFCIRYDVISIISNLFYFQSPSLISSTYIDLIQMVFKSIPKSFYLVRRIVSRCDYEGLFSEVCHKVKWPLFGGVLDIFYFVTELNKNIGLETLKFFIKMMEDLFEVDTSNEIPYLGFLECFFMGKREVIDYLIDCIFQHNPGEFPSLGRVVLDGDLLSIQKLVLIGMDLSQDYIWEEGREDEFLIAKRILGDEEDYSRIKLMLDLRMGNRKLIRYLMKNQIKRNDRTMGSIEVMKLLLEYGVPFPFSDLIYELRSWAFTESDESFLNGGLDLMVEASCDITFDDNSVINCLIVNQHLPLSLFKKLVELGADPTSRDSQCLKVVADRGRVKWIEYFCKVGCDVNCGGSYPLKIAARNGDLECIKVLIGLGADLMGNLNYLAEVAFNTNHLDVYEFMVKMGADEMGADGVEDLEVKID